MVLNQAFNRRIVDVQRLTGGQWITFDEGRVSGTQGVVSTRLHEPGTYRLRLLVHDPVGARRIPSATFTVRVRALNSAFIWVSPCDDGSLSVAHDGRILWELCSRADGATLRRTHHEDVGGATSFALAARRVWLLRGVDVLPLDASIDELLPTLPIVTGPGQRGSAIAAGASGVWVLVDSLTPSQDLASQELVRIDPATAAVTDRIPLPTSPGLAVREIHVGTRRVWLPRYPIHPADGKDVVD